MTLSTTWFFPNEYFIPHRLMLLARMIDRETARDLQAQSGLTSAEWRALAYICRTGRSSAAQICTAFEVDRAEVSRAVARLVEAGLIHRGRSRDQENRLTLTPTAAGEELQERVKLKRREYFDWILQDLAPGERQAFDEMLGRIAVRVDELRSSRVGEGDAEAEAREPAEAGHED